MKKPKLSGKRYSPLPDIYTPIDKTSNMIIFSSMGKTSFVLIFPSVLPKTPLIDIRQSVRLKWR